MPGKPQTGFDALIVGASVCGVATAVRVLEQEPAMKYRGASVTFLPAATRLLVAWGLGPAFEEYVTPVRCFTSKDGATGEVTGRAPCNIWNNARIRYDAEYSTPVQRQVEILQLTRWTDGGVFTAFIVGWCLREQRKMWVQKLSLERRLNGSTVRACVPSAPMIELIVRISLSEQTVRCWF